MSSMRRMVIAASVAKDMDLHLLIAGSITPAARLLWMAPDLLQIFLVKSDKSRMGAEETPEREG